MTEVLLPLKAKSSSNSSDRSDTICSECQSPMKNLPISDTCKICYTPVCTHCGCYTSSFDIYCKTHTYYVCKKAKKIGKNHYYCLESQNDFFTSKTF
jgi:hypothetical protein